MKPRTPADATRTNSPAPVRQDERDRVAAEKTPARGLPAASRTDAGVNMAKDAGRDAAISDAKYRPELVTLGPGQVEVCVLKDHTDESEKVWHPGEHYARDSAKANELVSQGLAEIVQRQPGNPVSAGVYIDNAKETA